MSRGERATPSRDRHISMEEGSFQLKNEETLNSFKLKEAPNPDK